MEALAQVDQSRLEEWRGKLAWKSRSLPRWLGYLFVRQFLIGLVAFFLLLPLLDGHLPGRAELTGSSLRSRIAAAVLCAFAAALISYRQTRDTLRLSLAEHRQKLEADWAKLIGPDWLGRVFRMGLFLFAGIGIPVGLVMALKAPTRDVSGGGRVQMVVAFLILTALWTFPMAFAIRWRTLVSYRKLRPSPEHQARV